MSEMRVLAALVSERSIPGLQMALCSVSSRGPSLCLCGEADHRCLFLLGHQSIRLDPNL